jgi:hypothetical protein
MENAIKILKLAYFLFFLTNFHSNAQIADQIKLQLSESRESWQQLKQSHKGNYVLVLKFESVFGFGTLKTYTFKNSKLMKLQKQDYTFNSDGKQFKKVQKIALNLISEKDVIDYDGIYQFVTQEIVNKSPEEYSLIFSLFDDGNKLIKICGFTPRGCMDDCFKGYEIDSIRFLK